MLYVPETILFFILVSPFCTYNVRNHNVQKASNGQEDPHKHTHISIYNIRPFKTHIAVKHWYCRDKKIGNKLNVCFEPKVLFSCYSKLLYTWSSIWCPFSNNQGYILCVLRIKILNTVVYCNTKSASLNLYPNYKTLNFHKFIIYDLWLSFSTFFMIVSSSNFSFLIYLQNLSITLHHDIRHMEL